jgi:hypothetical protein
MEKASVRLSGLAGVFVFWQNRKIHFCPVQDGTSKAEKGFMLIKQKVDFDLWSSLRCTDGVLLLYVPLSALNVRGGRIEVMEPVGIGSY